MSEVDQKAVSGVVQYIKQYKDQYSLDQLRQKLTETGYSKYIISEAESQVFKRVSQHDTKTSLETQGATNISTGRKIGEFVAGFIGYYVLVIVGFGLIGLGIAVFLYFYLRKKHHYIARGLFIAFILSLVLVVAIILFLMVVFGGLF